MSANLKPRRLRSPVAVALGARIKECRIEADKSQEELAYDACLDRTRISAIERGITNPTIETVATICYVLGMTLADLFQPLKISLEPVGKHNREMAPQPRRRGLR